MSGLQGELGPAGNGDPRIDQFKGRSPIEIVEALQGGMDPFELTKRVSQYRSEKAVLVDTQRLRLRATAIIAFNLPFIESAINLDKWLLEQIDAAWHQLAIDDDESHGEFSRDEFDQLEAEGSWGFAAEILDVPLSAACRICVFFNHLPQAQRRAFFGRIVEQLDSETLAAREGCSTEQLQANLDSALRNMAQVIQECIAKEGLQ